MAKNRPWRYSDSKKSEPEPPAPPPAAEHEPELSPDETPTLDIKLPSPAELELEQQPVVVEDELKEDLAEAAAIAAQAAELLEPTEPEPPAPELAEHELDVNEPAPVVNELPTPKIWRVEMREEKLAIMNGYVTKIRPGAELDERCYALADIEGLRSTPGITLVEVERKE